MCLRDMNPDESGEETPGYVPPGVENVSLPGRVVRRARTLFVRLAGDHPSYWLLLRARRRILTLAHGPP